MFPQTEDLVGARGGRERDPQRDLASLREVQAAAAGGRHAEAAKLAAAALADGLEHPLLLNVLALQFEQAGDLGRAEVLLQRAVALASDDLGARNALGLCLLRLDRPAEALVHFDTLLRGHPGLAFLHASRGAALLALGSIAAAESAHRRALELDPALPVALTGLAQIASRRGAYADARMWAEKALAGLPGLPDAVMSLAAAELGEREPERAEARLRALLADERVAAVDRAYALGLLGDVLDAQERCEEAFAAYTACNEALRQLFAPTFGGGQSALQYVRWISSYFERAKREDWRAPATIGPDPSAARGHVFVLGFPRSGTTLLEIVLEGHPDVVSLEEKESMIDGVREFLREPQDLERLRRADPDALAPLRASYWRRIAAAGVDVAGKVFVDKNPLNTLKLPLIARLFPQAKILFACRDPRDVVLSCFRHRFEMSAPMYELLSIEGAARYYEAVMGLGVLFANLLPIDVCLVRHEDVVQQFAREMTRICAFLGIDWAPAMGDFALRTKNRETLTPSTAQLVRGLNTEGLGHWRRYETQLAAAMPILRPWVERFYYDA
ncbi:MAG TPA: sulfotransferase [Steroidobacteraceae bacterium]|nr:sulfotransferase [Steroidobacteraceae bacterium]